MARPRTKKEVRTFLGMVGYYRQFIRNFAELAEPLTQLTKKAEPEDIHWTERAEAAFQILKEALTHSKLMRNPDFNKTFVLQTECLKHQSRSCTQPTR